MIQVRLLEIWALKAFYSHFSVHFVQVIHNYIRESSNILSHIHTFKQNTKGFKESEWRMKQK